ncbi:type VI secretion system baseplate subunit TssE [Pseudomonas tremae]
MNLNGSLFERLALDVQHQHSYCGDEGRLMASIASHLSKLLGTRAGNVKMLPDYGLPDLNNMSVSLYDSLRQSREAIENVIWAYEPRLSDIYVLPEENKGSVLRRQFFVNACVEVDGIKKPVRFFTTISGDGNVSVV